MFNKKNVIKHFMVIKLMSLNFRKKELVKVLGLLNFQYYLSTTVRLAIIKLKFNVSFKFTSLGIKN